jgi:branched-chain amino acid transport system permease protein
MHIINGAGSYMTTTKAEARLDVLPTVKLDKSPLLLAPVLALLAFPLIGSFQSWLTLTVTALAMGMIIFVIASGLTLIFGLMDVINFAHGVFMTVGAFLAISILGMMTDWTVSDSILRNGLAVLTAMLVAMAVVGVIGLLFERVIIRPVYGDHLKQILITMGGMIIGEELIKVIWGIQTLSLPMPTAFQGFVMLGDASIEKYRLIAIVIGVLVFAAMIWVFGSTKVGLLIRAGVQDREMVESLGYRIRRLFIIVFMAGSGLAGLGGVLWGLLQQNISAHMGTQLLELIFIVIIIGGLGSTGGCFIGSILVALMFNYAGFLAPKVALISNLLLMVLVLTWRPQGLYPVVKR